MRHLSRRGLTALLCLLRYVAGHRRAAMALQLPSPPVRAAPKARAARRDSRWDRCVARLEAFQRAHGHTLVRREDDAELHRWTHFLRVNYRYQAEQRRPTGGRRPRLSGAKLRRLDGLGFVWDVQEYRWNQRFRELEAFYNDTNHTQVPLDRPGGLYAWTQNQRREYKRWLKGENSTLTLARMIALEKLQFGRDMVTFDDLWHRKYSELENFHLKQGHADVPGTYADNPALGTWVMKQRTCYRRYADGEPSALTEERIMLLEKLDFSWKYREDKWHEMKLRLLDYYEAHGNLRIATNDRENSDLRLWLNFQRYFYNRYQEGKPSPMTSERVKALESEIPNFPWRGRNKRGPSRKDWARMFDAMREKGLRPGMQAKSHWFDGVNPLQSQVKSFWTEEDLLTLWYNQDKEDDDDDDHVTKKPK